MGAILAAQANRAGDGSGILVTFDDFLELRGPVDPDALFFIFHLLGEWCEKSAYTGRWPSSCGCRAMSLIRSSAIAITETSQSRDGGRFRRRSRTAL